jgi:hypothetical protein
MKSVLAAVFLSLFAVAAFAQTVHVRQPHLLLANDQKIVAHGEFGDELDARGLTCQYHNGPVIPSAKVVLIFWGPTFANAGSADNVYATTIQAFRNQYGTNSEYNVITQYYQIVGGVQTFIALSNLASGTADMFDTSAPPTNVSDSAVQGEVAKYLTTHTFNASTIYEVVIPSTSYSSFSGEDSCGGPNLSYCAYHSSYSSGSNNVIYAIEPYPSCSGCQWPGWTNAQNEEHFVTHETREAVTDPLGTGWWFSASGNELDDQCAWSPSPFLSGGYGYQDEFSNASHACVQTR